MKRFLLFLFILPLFSTQIFSQRFWVGTSSTDWNSSLNWSMTGGGAGGASVPGPTSIVTFDRATPNTCVLNSTVSTQQLTISGGTLSLGSAGALTVTSTFSMSGGSFNAGAGSLIVSSNTFTLSGGIFNGGSSTITIGNNFSILSPTSFLPGTSTVVFNGGGQQDVAIISGSTPGTFTFYNMTLDKPGSLINFTSSPADTFQINNQLLFTNGQIKGSGFLKVEKNAWVQNGFDGAGISMATTGSNPSTIILDTIFASLTNSNIGIAKVDGTVITNFVKTNPTDTIRMGNFNGTLVIRRGILQFPDNPPVKSNFSTITIEPLGTLKCTSNFFYNAGQHVNTGGTFLHNNGTYVFYQPTIPAVTQFTNHKENFFNLNIDIAGAQFNPSANDTLIVNGNLSLIGGLITGGSQSAFNVKGNMSFANTMVPTQTNTNLVFSGTTDQNLTFATGAEGRWNGSVTIDKPSGNLILQSPVILDEFGTKTFTFKKGIVVSSAINFLFFGNEYQAQGASNSSYVDGPVRFKWYNGFIFPTGNKGYYAPVQITEANNTDTFTAQYFRQAPPNPSGPLQSPIVNISTVEYWQISRINAVTSVPPFLWLSYDSIRSGHISDPSKLRVSKWDGTKWADGGNSQVSPPFIKSLVTYSTFSPFTLGSTDATANALPLKWVSFTVSLNDADALLEWKTASETNNDHFVIQRSSDGRQFTDIGKIAASPGGGDHLYSYLDKSILDGRTYYRVQQVDVDGKFTYSDIISVTKNSAAEIAPRLFPNPAKNSLTIHYGPWAGQTIWMEIMDAKGMLIQKQNVEIDGSGNWTLRRTPPKGTYTVRLTNGQNSFTKMVVFQ